MVDDAITVRVFKHRDAVGILAVVRHSALALGRPLLVHLEPIGGGLRLQIIEQPPTTRAIVFDAEFLSIALCNEDTAALIDRDRDWIVNHGIHGERARRESTDRAELAGVGESRIGRGLRSRFRIRWGHGSDCEVSDEHTKARWSRKREESNRT